MVPSRITSLIYINFDEPERILAQSWRNERALSNVALQKKAHENLRHTGPWSDMIS
jgi:hypothetical protein